MPFSCSSMDQSRQPQVFLTSLPMTFTENKTKQIKTNKNKTEVISLEPCHWSTGRSTNISTSEPVPLSFQPHNYGTNLCVPLKGKSLASHLPKHFIPSVISSLLHLQSLSSYKIIPFKLQTWSNISCLKEATQPYTLL